MVLREIQAADDATQDWLDPTQSFDARSHGPSALPPYPQDNEMMLVLPRFERAGLRIEAMEHPHVVCADARCDLLCHQMRIQDFHGLSQRTRAADRARITVIIRRNRRRRSLAGSIT
jgi:hypothetical protein